MVLWAWGYLLEVPKALRSLSSLTAGDRKAGEGEEVLSGAHGSSGSLLTPAYRDMAAHITTSTATTLVATDTKKKKLLGSGEKSIYENRKLGNERLGKDIQL